MGKRLIGVFLLAAGLFLGYQSVLEPLHAAENHESHVSVSMKSAIFFPLLVVVGLMYAILGDQVEGVLGSRHKPSPIAWILFLVLVGAGFLVYFYIKGELERKGYLFK